VLWIVGTGSGNARVLTHRDYPDATIIGVVGSVVMSTDGAAEARSGLWAVSRV
jgi:trans-aconitate methyltransferase